MLWNQDMTFLDVEHAHQLKAKQTKKASNPFNAVAKRNKKEKIAQPSAKDNPKIIWKPMLPVYSAPLEVSCASMAAKSRAWDVLSIRRKCISCKPLHQHQLICSCCAHRTIPVLSLLLFEAPGLEKPDPLQQEVDPKRLISSRSRNPARHHHNPTHMPAGGRVNVHHIACALCELADCVETLTLCAETHCVSSASTGA
jgi:hypothetical protein